ncbi:MAG: hypothetical protein GX575_02170 [Candidatus Anammoximicrobium sp.]|nr:hypothetical protein [Candidatus Anammoximicrobium sp.]
MRMTLAAVMAFLPAIISTARAAEVLWAEAEEYSDQHGSVGADRPPFGSRGACLGSNWGGAREHYAVYRFRLDRAWSDARVHLRYARREPGDALWLVNLDGKTVAERLVLPSTGGWGHRADAEWAFAEIRLGTLSPGGHALRLVSLADKNNTNLDGFFLTDGPFEPPSERTGIERVKRLPTDRPYLVDEQLTVEQFCPDAEDEYYPPEERQQQAAAAVPRVVAIAAERAVLAEAAGGTREVGLGQSAEEWDFVAVATDDGKPAAVFERQFARWGLLAYVEPAGRLTTIRKAVGRLAALDRPTLRYPPDYEQTLLDSRRDLLGEKVLAQQGDPSYASCAAFLPDLSGYTFLANEQSSAVVAVAPDGSLGPLSARYGWKPLEDVQFDPREHVPGASPDAAKRGLAGGYLPAIDYGFYDRQAKRGWEQIAFASPDGPEGTLQVYVYLRIADAAGRTQRKYFHLWARQAPEPIAGSAFFSRFLALNRYWERVLSEALQLELPEPRIADACRASLVRAFITYDGSAPRYGVGHYGAAQHATFPPTTLSMVNACTEWGLFGRAQRYLDYYLDHVVRDDGTFDYYGPAVSEYGQLLEAIAQYVRRSGQTEWLTARLEKITGMVERLRTLRQESLVQFPETDVRHGLIMGSPEADTRHEVNYYFSGDVWTWRGWTELGRLLTETGDTAAAERGKQLLAECARYQADIEASVRKSSQRSEQGLFVPPVAGFDKPFQTMTQDRFASYTNYRYWIEMLSAGCLRPEWQDAIIDYRVARGGELLGTTRFQGHLDDWPYAGYGYGLLLRDRVRHYLLGFYGDLAMHRMRGTFTAFEQSSIRGPAGRRYLADYCVPAQLVAPLLAKWMLVFEERDADVLWLCRAIPQRWLGRGGGVGVRRAVTRWGPVDFSITPRDDGILSAQITLPRADFPAEIRLRLRAPDAAPIRQVLLNGRPHEDVDAAGQYLRIARPTEQSLRLEIDTRQTGAVNRAAPP